MNKIQCLIISVLVILIITITGCLYEPDDNKILNHFIINNDYLVVDVDCDFVSGNECMWFVSIILKNKSTSEIINLNDFSYDDCEDELFYGWKYSTDKPKLNLRYGEIV